ncbi:ribonuclease E/G [Enterocloster sp.]|uniref:ribonuclease E/G n=1 Tax=Enterocloster sp. TaxID=2719315 RepID=UPI003AB16C11
MEKRIITWLRGRICTAFIQDGSLVELTLEDEDCSVLNRIYVGRVQKVVPGINAAFIDTGDGVGYYSLTENRSHLFTDRNRKEGPLRQGDEILVQISREGVKTKAPVLTANLSLPGRLCVVTAGRTGIGFSNKISDNLFKKEAKACLEEAPLSGFGVIVRTNAYQAGMDALIKECILLKERLEALIKDAACRVSGSCLYQPLPSYITGVRDAYEGRLSSIVTDDRGLYDQLKAYLKEEQPEDLEKLEFYDDSLLPLYKLYGLETVLDRALGKRVWLKSGGYLVIEPTEAMTVIDVNTGKYEGRKKMADTIRKINNEAAFTIAAQLRLRNLSGIIMVDFIDMEQEEDKKALLDCLKQAVSTDPIRTVVVDMTPLGLVELTRKKVRKPLYEQAGQTYDGMRGDKNL